LKILIDMNLSPAWAGVLRAAGHDAVHWSSIGRAEAEDEVLMAWALQQGHLVLTIDLDFSAILAATRAEGPSVLQVRTNAVAPSMLAERLLAALVRFEGALLAGAIITIDERRERARILPIRGRGEPREPPHEA
jgi:predicted nuclease of predicted toxin-antitoxin system